MDNVLLIRDPRGMAITWGADEAPPTNEQVIEKQEYMVKWLREIGFEVQRAIHIVAPDYLELTQRAQVLCELWFECEGRPTLDQWKTVHNDLWESWKVFCSVEGEPVGVRPPLPPLPHLATKLGVIEGGKE